MGKREGVDYASREKNKDRVVDYVNVYSHDFQSMDYTTLSWRAIWQIAIILWITIS